MAYQICTQCILDSNIPAISFNEKGICNFCLGHALRKNIAVPEPVESVEQAFIGKIKRYSVASAYDCLCLYSGGKDSTAMLFYLVKKLRLKVLAFTLDNWFLSAETYKNIEKVVSSLGVDHMFYKPQWDVAYHLFTRGINNFKHNRRSRQMAFLVGHVCWPCFVMISLFSIKTALEKNIPTIVVGTTPGQLIQKEWSLSSKYEGISDVYRSMIKPFFSIIDAGYRKKIDLPLRGKIRALKLQLVPFYESFRYNEKAAFETAMREFNWVKPQDTDSCSTNCLINALGIALHKKHYHLNPYAIPLAHDVREGLLSREDALRAVAADPNKKIIEDIALKLDLPKGEAYG